MWRAELTLVPDEPEEVVESTPLHQLEEVLKPTPLVPPRPEEVLKSTPQEVLKSTPRTVNREQKSGSLDTGRCSQQPEAAGSPSKSPAKRAPDFDGIPASPDWRPSSEQWAEARSKHALGDVELEAITDEFLEYAAGRARPYTRVGIGKAWFESVARSLERGKRGLPARGRLSNRGPETAHRTVAAWGFQT